MADHDDCLHLIACASLQVHLHFLLADLYQAPGSVLSVHAHANRSFEPGLWI